MLAALSLYNFDIHYKSGQNNVNADGLSRRPHEPSQEDEESKETDRRISTMLDRASLSAAEFQVLDGETMSTLCMHHGVNIHAVSQAGEQDVDSGIPACETLLCDESAVPDDLEDPVPMAGHSALNLLQCYGRTSSVTMVSPADYIVIKEPVLSQKW